MKYQLYNGEVELDFDDEKHEYRVAGEIVPGVTSALNMIGKPWLPGWAVKMGAEYLKGVWVPGESYDEIEIAEHLKAMKFAHRQKANRAADIGTLAHSYCEGIIKAQINSEEPPRLPINAEAKKAAAAFHEWIDAHMVEFIASEAKIYSRRYGFAGTIDFDAIVDGQRSLGDLKTSNGIYEEMWAQTAAYQLAREEEGYGPYDNRWIVRIAKDGTLDSECRPFGYEEDKNAFLAALTLHRWAKNGKP